MTGNDVTILMEEALKTGYKLTVWEKSFITGVSSCARLSARQELVVRTIYGKATEIDCQVRPVRFSR